MKRTRITSIRALAPLKKPGYLEAYFACGKVIRNGQWLEISDEDYVRLGRQYATEAAPAGQTPSLPAKSGIGLGDLVGKVATPIARAFNLGCVDKATGQLKRTSRCFGRKQKLNKIQL